MLEYSRIDISEGIDVNKTNLSKECDICHYWYFKDIGFKYEPSLWNGCHDLMRKAMSFNNVAIVYVKANAWKRETKIKRISKKIIVRVKSLNIIINKIVFLIVILIVMQNKIVSFN